MTQVHAPCVEGEVWMGTYGGAALHVSDEWVAVTADGQRHAL